LCLVASEWRLNYLRTALNRIVLTAGIEGSNIVNNFVEALVALKQFNQSVGVLCIFAQGVISSHGLHDFHKDVCFVTTNVNRHEDISLEIIVEASLWGD
jgi:hypothetical protein